MRRHLLLFLLLGVVQQVLVVHATGQLIRCMSIGSGDLCEFIANWFVCLEFSLLVEHSPVIRLFSLYSIAESIFELLFVLFSVLIPS